MREKRGSCGQEAGGRDRDVGMDGWEGVGMELRK